ncbi:interferon alpha/beta receptor 2-like isoform X2 [Rana temporaria]|uniref:interferon alpha/beta receptor 2-like isoform X2 n=1 Tax=Rana temporaria TaxID=8407 RepID=UPI001AAC7845|nr:interferon alpha/beta receptor 2-like isoform X2 [Rana temporaria]
MASLTPLLLICHAIFLVSAILQPPTNLTLVSKNFEHILTWDDPNNISVIYYKVDYQDGGTSVSSKSCSNITSRHCDLTKDFIDVVSRYFLQVRSFTDHEVSNIAVLSYGFTPLEETTLGPALVDVVPCIHCINVSIHPPISHLWDEIKQHNVSMVSDEVYPYLEYTVHFVDSAESSHTTKLTTLNATVILNLRPNTNYCVSVDITSESNIVPNIQSPLKCAITGDVSRVDRTHVILPAVCGSLLLVGLLLCLFALDKAGYIGMHRKFFPKMLKSLPQSESRYSGSNECISPTYIVPVEVVSKEIDVEKNQESEDHYKEGGYASRKKLLDSDTSAGDSSGAVLSCNSSSLESSDQMTGSSDEERISTMHPVDLDIITDSSGSFSPIPTTALESSSDLSFNNSGVFNVNLNSICMGNPVNTWTGLENGGSLEVKATDEADMKSDQGLSLNGDISACTSIVLVDLQPTPIEYDSDNYEDDLSDNGDNCDVDDQVVSGYMRR